MNDLVAPFYVIVTLGSFKTKFGLFVVGLRSSCMSWAMLSIPVPRYMGAELEYHGQGILLRAAPKIFFLMVEGI